MNKEILNRQYLEYTEGAFNCSDVSKDISKIHEECQFVLNDIYFPIPPLSISIQKETFNWGYKTLRTKTTTKIPSGRGVINIQVKLIFNHEMILMLHRFILQIRNNPFVYVKNPYIYDSIFGPESFGIKNLFCTVTGFRLSSYNVANSAFEAELDLRYFNYFPYSRNLMFRQELESRPILTAEGFSTYIFPVFGEKKDKDFIYNLKEIKYKLPKKEKGQKNSGISRSLKDFTKKNSKYNITYPEMYPAKSAPYVRYYNYLQVKSLLENFNIDLNSNSSEYRKFLSEIEILSLESGLQENLSTEKIVIGLHSKYFPQFTKNQIIKSMIEKDNSTLFYYNEYQFIQLPAETLKRYRLEIINGTENLENEDDRIKVINENKLKIAKWLTAITNNNQSGAQSVSKTIGASDSGVKKLLPRVLSSERNIEYPWAAQDFKFNKRKDESIFYKSEYYYYPITNEGYVKNSETPIGASLYKIYNSNYEESNNASFGLFPVYCPVNKATVAFDSLFEICTISNANTSVKLSNLIVPDKPSDILKNVTYTRNKGDLIGFCKDPYLTLEILSGEKDIFSKDVSNSVGKSSEGVRESEKADDINFAKLYNLAYMIDEDKNSFQDYFQYIADRGYFVFTDKEYISNVFFKTNCVIINNNLDVKNNSFSKLNPDVFNIINMATNALVSVSAGITNLIASIPILGQEYPTNQFLSSSEPNYQFNYISRTANNVTEKERASLPEQILILESIRHRLSKNAREYKFIPDGGYFLIDSFMTRLFGSFKEEYIIPYGESENYFNIRIKKPIAIDSFEERTIESSPGGSYLITRFSETNVYDFETLQEIKTNKTNIKDSFYKQVIANATQYCGRTDGLFNPQVSEVFKNNKRVLDQSTPGVPLRENLLPGDYKFGKWNTKYFNYKNFYGARFKSQSGELNQVCMNIINSYPGRDMLAYSVCKEVLDVLYDFYKYVCSKEGKNRQTPQIIITSGFDSALTTARPTISDHFLGSATDIKVLGRNTREVFLILDLMAELGIIKNPVYPGKKGKHIVGLGIYGENSVYNVGMTSNGVINGFVHVDLNVKKLLSSVNETLKGAARQEDINRKLSGSSTDLTSYGHGKERRWSGEEKDYQMTDSNGQYVKDWPDTQHYINYLNAAFDNFDFTLSTITSRYNYFKGLLLEFNEEILKGDLNAKIPIASTGSAEEEKDRKETIKVTTRPLEITKVEKDSELKEDWEDAIESALGESAFSFSVDTEDSTFEELVKTAGNEKSASLSKAINNLTKQGITGSTEIKTFEVDYGNDASGRYSDKITEFEKYAKDNNLVYSIVPADDEIDEKTGKPSNPNAFKIYVVNPKYMQNSLSMASNYQQSEMISLIELLCDFEYFASLLLLEPETYLENPTPEEIEKEYNRIKEALYDVNVTPSFFSNLEFASTGVLKYDYLNKLYSLEDSDSVKPYSELFSLRSLANKTTVDSSFIKKYYDNFGWHEIQGVALLIIEVAALVSAAVATGGASAIATAVSVGASAVSIQATALDLMDEGETGGGQQSNGLNNIRRVLAYVLSSFINQSSTYGNQSVFKKISERQKQIFTHIYSEIALKDRVSYNSDRDDLVDNLGYADDIDSGINELLSVFIEKNPILLKYVDLASELKSFKTISNLISFDYIKDDETVKKINFAANGLNPKLAKDYLRFLFCFPYGQFIDGDFFMGDEQDNRLLSLNNFEFDDNFVLDNEFIIREDANNDYRFRKQSETERFSIEDQVDFVDESNDKTSMLVKNNSFFESRKKELANEANVRIAYCRSILQEICKTLMSFPGFADSIPNLSYPGLEEFDFAYKNAFPDIDLPLDPADFSNNVNVNPGFFFYESNYELNIGNMQDDINTRAKTILNKSVDFTLNLQKGIYTGTKQVFDSKDKMLIKDFILKDQMDGASTTVLLEGGLGDKLKKPLSLGEGGETLKDQKSDVEIKINYENAPPDGDYTDYYENETITGDDVMSLDAFDIFKNAENPEYLKSIKDNLNTQIAGLDNAFGSRSGFLIEPTEVLSIYENADADDDNKVNKYLGLFADNQSYLQKEQLSEVLEKSGEYLLKKQQDMKRAYPTFKFYLIEEDSADSDKLFVYDDFYSFNAVKDFTIHKSRKLAADTAVIRLQNISGTLDGTKQGLIRDIDYEIDGTKKEQIESGQEGAFEKIESVVLRPGVSCQLRAGYDSNPANLTILLSGKIADVAWSSNGDMCEITVQSFGVELETKKYGLSQEDDVAKLEFHTTHKLLAYMMFRPELKHFGRYKKSRTFQYGEDKDVIVTRETFVGNNKSYGWADSIYDFMSSKWHYIVIASIAIRFGGTAILRKIGSSSSVDDVLTKVQPAAQVAATSAAAKEAGQKIIAEGLENSVILNTFKKGLTFLDDLASNTPYLGAVAKWIFEGGISIGVSSRTIITQAFDDIAAQVAANPATATVANEIAEEVITGATRTITRNGIFGYLRAGAEIFGRFFQVNTAVGGTAAGRLAQTGSTPQILLNLLGRDAATISVVTKHFAEKAWYSAYGSALWYGLTLGSMTAAKFVGVAYVAAKIIESSVAFGADAASALWKSLRDYIFGEFLPNNLMLSLSPQDDAIYAPHPNRYIKPVADSFDLFVDDMKKFGGKILTTAWNGISWFDLFGSNTGDGYFYESILKFKTLMMDRRLKAGFGENVYRIENSTVWEIFHEMSLRHPGWVYGARQYGQMMEYRMFFGLPNQRYFANPLNGRTINRLNKIFELYKNQDLITADEQKRQVEYLLTSQSYSYMKKNMNPSEDPNKEELVLEACKILLFDEWVKITNKRFVPFRNYHYISSRFNLVANNIIGSNNDVINEVGIMFTDAEGDEEPKLKVRSLRAHENIPSEQIHAKPVRFANCKGYNAALRYGISELVNSAKEMYRGEIMILGNPEINPYDVCILDDQYTEMFGPLEVESVTHLFNFETGFLTEIKPNALVTANEGITFPMLNSIIMYDIGRELAETAPSYLKKDKENLKERIADLLDDWLQEVDLWDTPIIGGSSNINLDAGKSFGNVGITGKLKIDEDIKNSIIDQIVNMVDTGNIEFQSSVLNPNANVNGIINTSGLTSTFTGLAATSLLTYILKGKGGYAASVFGIMAGISASSKEYLNYQLKTPGSFLANKLVPGDMLVSQVSDGNLIQIYPLYKNNKPMIYGGYERITPDKSIKNKLGNIFTQLSDAATAFNVMLEEYSDPVNLMYSDPSWVAESLFEIGEGLLPFDVPDGTVKGYFCKYEPEQAIQKSLTARK